MGEKESLHYMTYWRWMFQVYMGNDGEKMMVV
jgi:hypothetical protein